MNNGPDFVIDTMMTKLLGGLAAFAVTVSPIAATAQGVAQDVAQDEEPTLNLPSEINILGPSNPNLRQATAKVNGEIITGTDVDQRTALLLAASRNELSAEELAQVRAQVLRNLIDEKLQIQEARALELPIEDAMIAQRYADVAQRNGQTPDTMDEWLENLGSSEASLKQQIRGEVAWQLVLRRMVRPYVNVSTDEAQELLEMMEASKGTEEYRIGEIYVSSTPETRQQVVANLQQIMQQLRQGGNFAAYARQFSESSSAAAGGDLGFVRLVTLPAQMATAAQEMQAGQLVGPIEIPGGFVLMVLIDKRQILMSDPRDAELSLKQISISFPEGTTEAQAEARLSEFQTTVQSMRGCGDADSVAATIGANVATNSGIRARSLPAQLQSAVLDLQPGQTSPAFGSIEDGVFVLMLCGRDEPQDESAPDLDTIISNLENERISKRAERYRRDLRNDALIEYN
ncbi:peptidylprolyl isomerase [Qipengyuania sp. JC766]|uniref:peptidylprolyl isomerase n=1 Tax=Qipengyuania sp. JC766 TaxID=3232139 RepID=UPI0034587480